MLGYVSSQDFTYERRHTRMMDCSLSSLALKIFPKDAMSSPFIALRIFAIEPVPEASRLTYEMEPTPSSIPRMLSTAELGSPAVS